MMIRDNEPAFKIMKYRRLSFEMLQEIVEELQKEIELVSKSLNSMPISSNIIKQQAKLLTKKKEYQMFSDFKNGIVSINDNNYRGCKIKCVS